MFQKTLNVPHPNWTGNMLKACTCSIALNRCRDSHECISCKMADGRRVQKHYNSSGCLPCFKENWKTLGIMVKNSSFQDVVFCSGVCTYGSLTLNGTLTCSHYNCAWQIHSTFFRGLRIVSLYERFRHENKHCAWSLLKCMAD